MAPAEIREAVRRLDARRWSDQEVAWEPLRSLGPDIVPYLREAYPQFGSWQGRTCLVYRAVPYARQSDDAFALGLTAMTDRSYMVRYRACAILAYSLKREALPLLSAHLDDPHALVARSALAACNAILAGNHHLFADWSLSGRTNWVVNEADKDVPDHPPGLVVRARLGIRPVPPLESAG